MTGRGSRRRRVRPGPRFGGAGSEGRARSDPKGRRLRERVAIEQSIPPPQQRRTGTTHRLNAGAKRVDLPALLGHESVATTRIYTNVGQERMEQGVARL